MADTLTIVACDPDGDGMDDEAIAAMINRLQPIAEDSQGQHILERASSIEVLRAVLSAHVGAPPRVVQVIGHAAPGVLWLGRPWKKVFAESADGPVYVLDSTPYYYNILAGLVAPQTTVMLLGCGCGDTGTVTADGPTLLFDLSRMWGCAVKAPVDVVGVDDFDDSGLFRHPKRLATAKDNCIASPPAGSEPDTTDATETITFVRFLSAPCLGPRTLQPHPLQQPEANALHLPNAKEMVPKLILGAPETWMLVRLSGSEPMMAEVFANSRIIRVLTTAGPRTFVIDPLHRDRFRQAQRELIKHSLRLP